MITQKNASVYDIYKGGLWGATFILLGIAILMGLLNFGII